MLRDGSPTMLRGAAETQGRPRCPTHGSGDGKYSTASHHGISLQGDVWSCLQRAPGQRPGLGPFAPQYPWRRQQSSVAFPRGAAPSRTRRRNPVGVQQGPTRPSSRRVESDCRAVSEYRSSVPGEGVEPSRSCLRRFLRPLRLPFRHPGPRSTTVPRRGVAGSDRHALPAGGTLTVTDMIRGFA